MVLHCRIKLNFSKRMNRNCSTPGNTAFYVVNYISLSFNRFIFKIWSTARRMSEANSKGIPVAQLPIKALMQLKDTFELDMQKLTATIQLTNESVHKAQLTREAISTFASSEKNKTMLVPITESMYAVGRVAENNRPIIEIGTGYFAETSVDNALAFFARKIGRLNSQQEALRQKYKESQMNYEQIVEVLNQRIQAAQQRRNAQSS